MTDEQHRRIIKKYHAKCVLCDSTRNIIIHHRNYENVGNEKDTDLIVLCKRCHTLFHTRTGTRKPKISTDTFEYLESDNDILPNPEIINIE